MILRYCTNRDINGHRKVFIMNTDTKQYAFQAWSMCITVSDYIVVKRGAMNKIIDMCKNDGYTWVNVI